MKTVELDTLEVPVASNEVSRDGIHRDLLSALVGNQAGRDRAVAHKTRRVVLASLGVMQDQKAGRKRGLALALAAILLVGIVMGPFFWRVADELFGGELFADTATQLSLWVGILLCPALLAAALVAGWLRKKP